MNIHCGTFVGGLWGAERGERKPAFRTWLKILTGPSIWSHWLLERANTRLAAGRFWVADSLMVKLEVQRYYPIPDDRFFIAHSGVDAPAPDAAQRRTEWRARLGFKDGEVVALFVASEFRRKGLGALLEALGRLGERGPRLVVVGGEDRAPYGNAPPSCACASASPGPAASTKSKDYYALADIFVLPTLSDPSPLAPLEAMAHGCAAIISCGRFNGGRRVALERTKPSSCATPGTPRKSPRPSNRSWTQPRARLTPGAGARKCANAPGTALPPRFWPRSSGPPGNGGGGGRLL